jgi:hypothetical protein
MQRFCRHCGDLILRRPGEKMSKFKWRKFCSELCAGERRYLIAANKKKDAGRNR